MFHIFFNSLAKSRYWSFFSLSFSFIQWSTVTAKSIILQVLFFVVDYYKVSSSGRFVIIISRISIIADNPDMKFVEVVLLYSHVPYHNDSIIVKTDAHRKTHEGRRRKKTQEDFFNNIFTSHFIARVRKVCWRFACERMLETEHKLHILTPLLWPSRCVFLVLLDAQPEVLGSTPSGLFWGPPSVGCGLPYHIWSLLSGSLLATALGPKLNWVK